MPGRLPWRACDTTLLGGKKSAPMSIPGLSERLFRGRAALPPRLRVSESHVETEPKPEGDHTVRFLGLLKADKDSEAGAPPSAELMEKMGKFIEEITKAGVLLATAGLQPSSKGARVRLS